MPVKIRKVRGGYRASTPGGMKSRRTTKRKALRQKRLLHGIESGKWKPTRRRKH